MDVIAGGNVCAPSGFRAAGALGGIKAESTKLDVALVASDRNDQLCRGELLPGIPLAALSSLESQGGALHVAIGDNRARENESTNEQ